MDSTPGPIIPDQDIADESIVATPDRRRLIIHGLAWNSAFQVFVAAVNFISMLVLVRIIPPAEYGRAAAALGVLGLLNCFNCGFFIAQAIQLGERDHPDWDMHWRVGLRIQFAIAVLCNIIAGCLWFSDSYRPIAPLLHLASLGLLVEAPYQLSWTMLRREMDFRRMRFISAAAVVTSAVVSIGFGMNGFGAAAMILGSNVCNGLPFGIHLLFLRRWRPKGHWFTAPEWSNYRPALRFGAQSSGTAMLAALRALLESVVLPRTIGYQGMGLLNRAQVLFSTTVGRVAWLVMDTVYPLLPRSAHDPAQFARHATLVAQTMLLFSIPGAAFLLIEGPTLSRLLYGAKWIAADPLIAPGTILAWGISTALVFGSILLAANRLNVSLAVSVTGACLTLPAMTVALLGNGMLMYVWTLAAGQCVAAGIAMVMCTPLLDRWWIRQSLFPPTVAGMIGALVLVATTPQRESFRPAVRLAISAFVFALVMLLVMRAGFAGSLRTVVACLPGSEHWLRWLKLSAAT